jgi:hypothetical protein
MKMVNLYTIKMEMKLTIKNFLMGVLGFIIIFYYIYLRLILVRLPKNLSQNLDLIDILFLTIIIAIFAFLTIYNYCYYFNLKYTIITNNPNFKQNIILGIKNLVTAIKKNFFYCLTTVDNLIKHEMLKNNLGIGLKKGIKFIYTKINFMYKSSSGFYIFYFAFDFLPKMIVLTSFIFDLFLYSKFDYVYKLSFLLIIPLIFNYILFTYKEFAEFNINLLNIDVIYFKFHDGTIMSTDDHIQEATILEFDPKEPFRFNVVELSEEFKTHCYNTNDNITETILFYSEQFGFFKKIRRDIAIFDLYKAAIGIPFNIIRFFIYFLLWSYVLFYGFGFFL